PKTYELKEVPVHFLTPAGLELPPRFLDEPDGRINLLVIGPNQEEAPPVHVYVDLTPRPFRPRPHEHPDPPQLPKDFHLAEVTSLRKVAVELISFDSARLGLGKTSTGSNE